MRKQYGGANVSDEELLSLLYGREINLRKRFEEAIRQIEEVRDDLSIHFVDQSIEALRFAVPSVG